MSLSSVEAIIDARIAALELTNSHYASLLACVSSFATEKEVEIATGDEKVEESLKAEDAAESRGSDALASVDGILDKARRSRGANSALSSKADAKETRVNSRRPPASSASMACSKASFSSSKAVSLRSSPSTARRTESSAKGARKSVTGSSSTPATRLRESRMLKAHAKGEGNAKASSQPNAPDSSSSSSSSSSKPPRQPSPPHKQLSRFATYVTACSSAQRLTPRFALQGLGTSASTTVAQSEFLSGLAGGRATLPPSAVHRALWSERVEHPRPPDPFEVLPRPLTLLLPTLYRCLGMQSTGELLARCARSPVSQLPPQDIRLAVRCWYRLRLYFDAIALCAEEGGRGPGSPLAPPARPMSPVRARPVSNGADELVRSFVMATPLTAPVLFPPAGGGREDLRAWRQCAFTCIDTFYVRMAGRVQYCIESSIGKRHLRRLLRDLKSGLLERAAGMEARAGAAAGTKSETDFNHMKALLKRFRALWVCLVEGARRVDSCIFVRKA